MNIEKELLDAIQELTKIVSVEQDLRADLQKRVAALERNKPQVIVDLPRLNMALRCAKES